MMTDWFRYNNGIHLRGVRGNLVKWVTRISFWLGLFLTRPRGYLENYHNLTNYFYLVSREGEKHSWCRIVNTGGVWPFSTQVSTSKCNLGWSSCKNTHSSTIELNYWLANHLPEYCSSLFLLSSCYLKFHLIQGKHILSVMSKNTVLLLGYP